MKIFLDTNVILELKFRTPESQASGCNVRGHDIISVRITLLKPVRAFI